MLQHREYDINQVVMFNKTKEKFGGLSNMASGYSLNIGSIIIPSSEHLYQAMRYSLFPEIQAEIIAQNSPMTAKMISRKYLAYSRQDWDLVKIKVMRWALEIKLSQNWDTFSDVLLSTGNLPIVELSYKDKIWGAVKNDNKLIGVNALGRLLMELRDKYVITGTHNGCIDPPNIVGFLLYSNEIGTVCNDEFLHDIEYATQEFSQC